MRFMLENVASQREALPNKSKTQLLGCLEQILKETEREVRVGGWSS